MNTINQPTSSCGGTGCDIKPYILPYGIAA